MPSVVGAIKAGRAFVELFADDSRLVSGLRRAQHTLNAFGRDLLRVGAWIQGIGVALAAPFALSTKIFTETGDRLDAMSKRTGFAVESLSQLELATQLIDFSMQGMENALKRMQRTLVQMATGTDESSRALDLLQLNINDIIGLSPEDQLGLIADRLAVMTDKTLQAGASMAIFGREATGILPMLLSGAKGLKEYKEIADRLGLTIDGPVVAAADHLNDIIEVIKNQINRLAVAVGGVLEPILTPLAERIVRIAAQVIKWAKSHGELIRTIAKIAVGIVALGAAVFGLGVVFILAAKAIGAILLPIVIFKALISVIASVITSLVFVLNATLASALFTSMALFAALSLAILIWTGDVSKAVSWVGEKFKTLKNVFIGTLQGIIDGLLSGNLSRATRIMLLGVELAWKTGLNAIRDVWANLWTSLVTFGVDRLSSFEAIFLDLGAFIAESWTAAWARVGDVWDEWAFQFKTSLVDLGAFVKDVADSIAIAFVPKEHREEVLKQLRQETIDLKVGKQGTFAKDFLERSAASTEQLAHDLKIISDRYEAAMAKIGDANLGTNRTLQDNLKEDLKRTETELKALTDEWEQARAEAAAMRREVEEQEIGPISPPKWISDAIEMFDSAARASDVTGTFTNALLLGQGGTSSSAERTANATESSARLLGDLKEMAKKNGLVFEP